MACQARISALLIAVCVLATCEAYWQRPRPLHRPVCPVNDIAAVISCFFDPNNPDGLNQCSVAGDTSSRKPRCAARKLCCSYGCGRQCVTPCPAPCPAGKECRIERERRPSNPFRQVSLRAACVALPPPSPCEGFQCPPGKSCALRGGPPECI